MELATFGGGCFWCTEAIFQRLKGVVSVVPGYAGGQKANPTYEEVSGGNTGHAEVIQVEFDPAVLSYEQLLYVFFKLHDPTQMNRQGNDVGTQYRSVVFAHNDQQKQVAMDLMVKLNASGDYKKPIATEVAPYTVFYKAEDYHRNYYNSNSGAGYCMLVIDPKITKLYKEFGQMVKPEAKQA
jgi:peptide-methionine (S)-S-oxide reductase